MKIEVRWSGGNASRIKDYSAELVKSVPDIIVANGSPVLASMKQATRSIPIVFVVVNDPVEQGFILSMAHPGQRHRVLIHRFSLFREVASAA